MLVKPLGIPCGFAATERGREESEGSERANTPHRITSVLIMNASDRLRSPLIASDCRRTKLNKVISTKIKKNTNIFF